MGTSLALQNSVAVAATSRGKDKTHEYSRLSVENVDDESVSIEGCDEASRIHMEDEDLKVLEEGLEESFEHIGFAHLQALGAASASLGLISTLVFSPSVE